MSRCEIRRTELPEQVVYTLNGDFDGIVAGDLAGRLSGEPRARVLVDFSQVGRFADQAVAVLSRAVQPGEGRQVRLLGLRQHQERLLRYFGVDFAPHGPAADS